MVVLRIGPTRGCPSIGLRGSFRPLEREEMECGEEGQEAGLEEEAIEPRLRPVYSVSEVMGGRTLLCDDVEEENEDGVQVEECWSEWYLYARSESLLCIAERRTMSIKAGWRRSRSSRRAG